jgi:rhamnosyltransferase
MKDSVSGRPMNGEGVCAIVVTYHPDSEFPVRLGRILPQVGALVIVDNGSAEDEIEMLRECAANPSITLVLNANNLGIARALNVGMQRAVAREFTWALLLDQDSCVNDDMVESLLAVQSAFPNRAELAVIGSGYRDVNKKEPPQKSRNARALPSEEYCAVPLEEDPPDDTSEEGHPWEEAQYVITSGSLIPLATHAAVGPFREEFFIDHVDIDYCLRARAKGLRIIKTRTHLMSHAVGAYTLHSWLWMNKWTTNHSPDRRYYFARNDTVMLREHGGHAFGLWRLKSFARCFRLCKRILLYEHEKAAKVSAVARGWWDGIRGHMGPREHRRPKNLSSRR